MPWDNFIYVSTKIDDLINRINYAVNELTELIKQNYSKVSYAT